MAVDRAGIVQAALDTLDQYGFADLSMRRIAQRLGVQASAIYWHFPSKQDLLAGVSDAILAPLQQAPPPDLAAWMSGLRQALLARRDAAELVSSTLALGLGSVDPAGVGAQCLAAAGWDAPAAGRAARAMVRFVLGHVVEEQSRAAMVALGVLDGAATALDEDGFALGQALLLAGAESLGAAAGASAGGAGAAPHSA